MKNNIQEFLNKLLITQYGEKITNQIIKGYTMQKPVTIRVNTIKTNKEIIKEELIKNKISFVEVDWYKDALILEDVKENQIKELKMYKQGEIYLQSLSSMIPAIILQPQKNENILDMAAAPGGKTTQIVALSNNEAMITACEKNKIRAEKLKYNLEKQGANKVNIMIQDSSMLSNFFAFDKILLDTPCSGSGTKNVYKENFTEELIEKSVKIQEKLLKKALQILKKGQEMVYSTCSILQEENENILNKVLPKYNAKIVNIDKNIFNEIPLLPTKIDGTICIQPNQLYDGFFIAKILKQ